MKLFTRRSPIAWGAFTFGVVFTALFVFAVATGDAFVPGRRSTPSTHFLRTSDPRAFSFWLRFYGAFAAIGLVTAFLRVVPIEDGWRRIRARSKSTIQTKGYDSKPAPKWAYAFLLGFLGLIVWVGWKTMYSE
jgi:hypothetical protein